MAYIIHVKTQMETFDFFFGVFLGDHHTNNLSKTLQSSTISELQH